MVDKTKTDKLHAEELKELILLKCSSHPNSSTDSMEYIKKSHWHFFFTEIDKYPISHMGPQRTINSQSNLEKEQNWSPHFS